MRRSARLFWSAAFWLVLAAGVLVRASGALPRNLGAYYLSAALLHDDNQRLEKAAFWLQRARSRAGPSPDLANSLAVL